MAVGIIILLSTLGPHRQAISTTPVSPELRHAYDAYRLGQFKEAAEIFEAEFIKTDRPNLLFNAARSRLRLKQWRRTRLLLQRYLQRSTDENDLADAKRMLAEVWAKEEIAVEVRSDPAGARLYWQDKFVGNTPQRFKVRRGDYALRLEHGAHKTLKQRVTIKGTEELEIVGLVLKKMTTTGTLVARSKPPGLDIWVAGKRLGSTPLERKLNLGRHELLFQQSGKVLYHEDIEITAGHKLAISAEFERARKYRTLFIAGIALAGVALASEGAAIGLTVDANGQFNDSPAFKQERAAAIGLHVGAALSAAISAGLLIWQALGTDLQPKRKSLKTSWQLAPTGARISF